MARDTSSLPVSNVFKPATTTTEACVILSTQLTTYTELDRLIANQNIVEALRANDLSQIRQILSAIASQLQAWLTLPDM